MLKNSLKYAWLDKVINSNKSNFIQPMESKIEKLLNPNKYTLSNQARKRLKWMYVLYYECGNNATKAANKIGISREWLSKLKSVFEQNNKSPLSLESESKAPHDTSNRQRISKRIEDKILEVRNEYPYWGEQKIAEVLKRDHKIKTGKSTVNRYLHKHNKIDPLISARNEKAWQDKKEREEQKQIELKVKYRPPKQIKDWLPGALIEKDMKLVSRINFKANCNKYRRKDNFWFQHTFEDSFTRIRHLGLTKEESSEDAVKIYLEAKKELPFSMASINTDNGGENEKEFSKLLVKGSVIHFYSREGTPTDNPRAERSHLTDQKEFYDQGKLYSSFNKQKQSLKEWNYVYNYIRPHQALGYLTPMRFYEVWKKNPEQAYQIAEEYQEYLKKQRTRSAKARRLKRKEQIDKVMRFIENKLNNQNTQEHSLKTCQLGLTINVS